MTREALDRAMRAAGWKSATWTTDVYEREAPKPFELRAQFWLEGDPVELQTTLWLACDGVDRALEDLGEDGVMAWVSRVPFDEDVVIAGPEGVEAVVAQLGPVADELLTFATVDAFVAELARDPETSEDAAKAVPVVLAVAKRRREARERARLVPGDFAERLDRWLAGERPPPPEGFDDRFPWGQVLRDSIRKVREERSVPPENRVQRPQVSWHDVGRTARTLYQALRGELPDGAELPGRRGDWRTVELGPDAAPVLERARADSPVAIWVGAAVQVRVEPAGEPGRMRVLVDGADVGSVPAPEGQTPATLPAKIDRLVRDGPLVLSVQFADGSDGAQS